MRTAPRSPPKRAPQAAASERASSTVSTARMPAQPWLKAVMATLVMRNTSMTTAVARLSCSGRSARGTGQTDTSMDTSVKPRKPPNAGWDGRPGTNP